VQLCCFSPDFFSTPEWQTHAYDMHVIDVMIISKRWWLWKDTVLVQDFSGAEKT
jgi:hypothetical protein